LSSTLALLDERSVVDYLRGRGLDIPANAQARELGGGVSNVVLSVAWRDERVVVKQSLPRLKVESEWFAPVDRILREARSIQLMNHLLPDAAPELVSADPERFVIAMTGAPSSWTDWKQCLMGGDVRSSVAAQLGTTLGELHARTSGGAGLHESFFDGKPFEQLRIDPYFVHAAQRVPEIAPALMETVAEMTSRRSCLVHGDFSPKNLLVDPQQEQVWVIDFEVAHFGDPAFDLAFLLTHLVLKAVHRPQDGPQLDGAATAFVSSYLQVDGNTTPPDLAHVLRLVGCLLAARAEGKSPVEYLSSAQRATVLKLATAILKDRPTTLNDLALARTQGES